MEQTTNCFNISPMNISNFKTYVNIPYSFTKTTDVYFNRVYLKWKKISVVATYEM